MIAAALRTFEKSMARNPRELIIETILEGYRHEHRMLAEGTSGSGQDTDMFTELFTRARDDGKLGTDDADVAHLAYLAQTMVSEGARHWAAGAFGTARSPMSSPRTSSRSSTATRTAVRPRPPPRRPMWDFETDPEYQELLDWADEFVRDEVEPLDLHLAAPAVHAARRDAAQVVDPLKEQVREKGLWATHLGPELGGQGYGQLKLALLNEILGRSQWAPIVFGCQAPDTGNAEIIAHYGTPEQKERYLRPLLDGELFSCYSMTEPQGGADPTQFTTRAVRDGDDWVINGWKYFSSNASTASFLIVMVVTNPDVSPYQGMSMFLVPTDTPGVHIVRNVGLLRRGRGRGQPRADPLRRRARARRRRCSAARGRRSRSPRPASAAAASTTRCAPSGWRRRRST